ncbi:hypothetical protein E2C01_053877 [Portunus trituberculatus]|uniref:Uncharacterized protein n=1 Tax=Portunus trituberculatus TaxID=210409 RepID=A0A5B7GQD2_PORTR|nr:hypothetical protein [Portunus trituberculatus]
MGRNLAFTPLSRNMWRIYISRLRISKDTKENTFPPHCFASLLVLIDKDTKKREYTRHHYTCYFLSQRAQCDKKTHG